MTRLFGVLVLVLSLAVFPAYTQSTSSTLTDDQLKLFNLVNQERQNAGLAKLQWDDHLAQSARAHAQLLAQHEELSHQFEGEAELGQRVGITGLRFNAAAENVASAPTVGEAHQGLMHSPGHRANIMNPNYNAVGMAIIRRGDQLYVAQNFARVLPTYTDVEFQDAVVAAFNQTRRNKGIALMSVRPDPRLIQAACIATTDPNGLIKSLPGATDLVIFTSSTPDKLPANMQKSAGDPTLHRMNIGTCFKPSKERGYGSFEVVAAFYPVD
ncbi:MAG TPA: CAP domain-containing protein [Candidatus Angelobacter sp.]|nr:CAP domain-containing protein [Candidatus Angelobacter sp.]